MHFEQARRGNQFLYLLLIDRIDIDKMERHLTWERKVASEPDRWLSIASLLHWR